MPIVLAVCFSAGWGQDVLHHVNPFIGTDGHGHTFPGATLPFGMVQLSPDTRVAGWDACAGYHYSDSTVIGFSHTHLSGTGVADYGDILFMPTVGALKIVPGDERVFGSGYRSRFRHQNEKASPGYYEVLLEDYNVRVALTATRRVGFHRYTFPKSDSANVIIDLVHGLGPDRVVESSLHIAGDAEIEGYRRSEGWAKDQRLYFVAQFSRPFIAFGTGVNDSIRPNHRTASGTHIKGYVRFSTRQKEQVLIKVGISTVSIEGARSNLRAEIPLWDFEKIKSDAERAWQNELGKIEIEGGAPPQRTTFYTAVYHALLAPNLFSDADGSYRGMDGRVHRAEGFEMYTVFSLWDTFRAEHPLLTIIDQKRTLDFIKSIVAKYEEGGVLPVWELAANETWCMIGYHAVPVIADAYLKGLRGFDAEKAFAAMKHSASLDHFGLKYYREHGYIPGELESESVSKTLEYAYDDWCIAQMARALGKREDERQFSERAQFYKNVYDASSGFMRAKVNGSWVEPFDPTAVTNHYAEANPWQYHFFVPHDVDGLIKLMGGRERFVAKLDTLFNTSSRMAGRQQADITGMIGQYAQGNEPSHHVAYLYNDAAAPWKTQRTVRLIMDSLFHDRPEGLCGNDDCGQMSAWYVMSALGLYQVAPGRPVYNIGSPLFPKATMHLEDGNKFIVTATNNSLENKYIQSALLNGKTHSTPYLDHANIMNGGELKFIMGERPNLQWGVSRQGFSSSHFLAEIVTTPYAVARGKSFKDSTTIALVCNTPGAKIFYTTSGDNSISAFSLYTEPIVLPRTTSIRAFAAKPGMMDSKHLTATFVKFQSIGAIERQTRYDDQYTGGGDEALVDGMRGKEDFRLGAWQGFHEVDLEAIIDLGAAQQIDEVALGCLQDNNSWIFFPTVVEFSFSENGASFHNAKKIVNDISAKDSKVSIQDFDARLENAKARFVRVHAKNVGRCPEWHKGAGGQAWLFVDEIIVKTRP